MPKSARTEYVALLRGINVGGNNVIKMTALKACFEAQGFTDVRTYIQSGNVLFKDAGQNGEAGRGADGGTDSAALTRLIEKALEKEFSYAATVVVRSRKEMKQIVERAPDGFGSAPAEYRYDVIYLMPPVSAADALKVVPTRDGVDNVFGGKGVLYFSRLISRATQSQLGRVVGMPIYKSMTIRNWNTTIKLLHMMEAQEVGDEAREETAKEAGKESGRKSRKQRS
jgi:uncharacterized protein (DUF1697 family)